MTPAGRLSGPRFITRAGPAGVVGGVALSIPVVVVVLWLAVHRITGLAPWLADALRKVIGVEGVATVEEFAYGAEDRFYSVWRRGEKPRAYWVVPSELEHAPNGSGLAPARAAGPALLVGAEGAGIAGVEGSRIESAAHEGEVGVPAVPRAPFRPRHVGAMYAQLDAPGDGHWVALPDGAPPLDAIMFKTLLHPDTDRAWAELFVVALDLRRVRLQLAAGTVEPQATHPGALNLFRPGRVPDEHHAGVLAAFNGGFKTEHGHYGMSLGGVTIVPPLPMTCTIAMLKDGTLRIGTWSKLEHDLRGAAWWRQTPACMYEDDVINQRLAGGRESKWGSALDGETVVRRSAIGLDRAGTTLYVGISNHTTAPAIARGMHHAGAATVAQLDINFSFPKFVTFRESPSTKLRVAVPLADGFEYSEHEYLRKASARDFFYVMDSSMDGRTARN